MHETHNGSVVGAPKHVVPGPLEPSNGEAKRNSPPKNQPPDLTLIDIADQTIAR
jgi:hypothetical protein